MKCEKCGHDPKAIVYARYEFTVDREPSSLNDRLSNVAGFRGRAYRKERDAWCWEFRAARLLLNMPKVFARRRVTLTRMYDGRQRERDRDNLAGGMKSVVDAMVSEGLLLNDTAAAAEIHYQQERGGRGLRVLIEEID